jgi:branched-chain amino acid transport system ATP-binding protein
LEPTRPSVLRVQDLAVSYGHVRALKGVSLEVFEGETVALIGANGAGKSTLVETVVGLHRPSGGSVHYRGHDVTNWATSRTIAAGVSLVPEGRGVVPMMTVLENLQLGAYHLKGDVGPVLARMFERFPILAERRSQLAGALSGGEQQMLVIARALMGAPRLLLLDEPSIGLSPVVVSEVFRLITELKAEGYTILVAEQNARKAMQCADRVYVFETGSVALEGVPSELSGDPKVQHAYLGGT